MVSDGTNRTDTYLAVDMQVHFCEGGQLVDAGHAHLHIYIIDDIDYKPSTQRRQNKKNNV